MTNTATLTEPNVYEALARERKAARLALAVAIFSDVTAIPEGEDIDSQLRAIAHRIGLNPPSDETLRVTRELFAEVHEVMR